MFTRLASGACLPASAIPLARFRLGLTQPAGPQLAGAEVGQRGGSVLTRGGQRHPAGGQLVERAPADAITASLSPIVRDTAIEKSSNAMRVPATTSGSPAPSWASARARWGRMSAKRLARNRRVAAASASSGELVSCWVGMRARASPSPARSADRASGRAWVTSSRPISPQSCASAACRSASSGSPWSLNQWAARRCRSGTTSGDSTDKPVAQHLAEQGVVPEPGAARSEADHEGVRRGEVLQELLAAGLVGELLGEGRVEPLDDRRAQEEPLHVGGCRASTSSARNSTTAWSSPPKSAARWPGWSRVRNSAASRSPAGQPSVRSTSSSASPARSTTPSLATSAAASATVRARSAERTSTRSPATRNRCSASAGSARVSSTSLSWATGSRRRRRARRGPPRRR